MVWTWSDESPSFHNILSIKYKDAVSVLMEEDSCQSDGESTVQPPSPSLWMVASLSSAPAAVW